MPKMPWGKFEGDLIYNVPDDYLRWFLDHSHWGVEAKDEWIFEAIEKELEERAANGYYVPAE